ncbi:MULTISPECIES: SRPBCC family protein [Methylomonas]|uniref:Polyketide cyclase n=2 Tax=Methylomonas TaxID=416 RepID=A0A126T8L2_9GAMM|nr:MULTISPECIES: SRPBCC family protein [Methylomonas]AMK78425.1 polyketide cyclase [Methylomonas denitrificans]OAI04129.1 polyketide cyclase [Methylomonas methanica]TCV87544.1 polyketide cyclase/dehydrase/lipid transport protein [Methylomonas methanica]
MLETILIVLVVAVLIVLLLASKQPETFQVTRSASMAVPPETVFVQINDLQKWEAWSPWAKLDPNAKNSFSGPQAGVGASMSWAGNNKVGEGSMTIIESRPHDLIRFKLDFLKPFKASNTAEFTFKSEGNNTVVVWSMYGKNNFIGKIMSLIMNCDKMVGGQFEQGLSAMKAIVEAAG